MGDLLLSMLIGQSQKVFIIVLWKMRACDSATQLFSVLRRFTYTETKPLELSLDRFFRGLSLDEIDNDQFLQEFNA